MVSPVVVHRRRIISDSVTRFCPSGTAIAGKNVANPIAMINASVDMLEHLGHHYHADLIRRAVNKTINVDKVQPARALNASHTYSIL